jgi:hypothetical protein
MLGGLATVLGEALVERTGRHRLETLPAYHVISCGVRRLFLRVSRMPYDKFRRRGLASHLGIQLRPLREYDQKAQAWRERDWPGCPMAEQQGDEAEERLPELRSGTGRFRALALAASPWCSTGSDIVRAGWGLAAAESEPRAGEVLCRR